MISTGVIVNRFGCLLTDGALPPRLSSIPKPPDLRPSPIDEKRLILIHNMGGYTDIY